MSETSSPEAADMEPSDDSATAAALHKRNSVPYVASPAYYKRKRVKNSDGTATSKRPKAGVLPLLKLNHVLFAPKAKKEARTAPSTTNSPEPASPVADEDVDDDEEEAEQGGVKEDEEDGKPAAWASEDEAHYLTRGSIVHKIRFRLGKLDEAMLREDPYLQSPHEPPSASPPSSSARNNKQVDKKKPSQAIDKDAKMIGSNTHSEEDEASTQEVSAGKVSPATDDQAELESLVKETTKPEPAKYVVCHSKVMKQFNASHFRCGTRVIVKEGFHRGKKGVIKAVLNEDQVVVCSDDGKMWTSRRSILARAHKHRNATKSRQASGLSTDLIKRVFLECLDTELEVQRTTDDKEVGRFMLSPQDERLVQPYRGRIDSSSCARVWAVRALGSIPDNRVYRHEQDEEEMDHHLP